MSFAVLPERFRAGEPEWTIDALFAAVWALHGPVDVALAAATWQAEANTLVSQLGLWPWVTVKLFALALASFVWYDYRRASPEPYPLVAAYLLGCCSTLAVVLILPNAFIIAGL